MLVTEVRWYGGVRVRWLEAERRPASAPHRRRDRLNVFAAAGRRAARYLQRAAFEQLEDYLLDDIGVDVEWSLRSWREREKALRRVWLAGLGGFL